MAGAPLYVAGALHIYLMLRSSSAKLSLLLFLVMAYGCAFGGVWMGSRASISAIVNSPNYADLGHLVELYDLRYESLLQVTRVAVLVVSMIYIWLVAKGGSSYPMGIAVGDYNNDDRVDFFFSNVGSTPPDFVIRGDTTDDQVTNWKWFLFRNDGDFKFTDTAEETKVADYEFSWGAIFEDLNLDGREDLIVSENYVGFPPHNLAFLRLPGRLLIQNTQGEFAAVGEQAGVVNSRYSITPLTADFNGDGCPDLVHANIAGRSLAFISQPGEGTSVKVLLANQVESIGAKVTVTLSDGSTQSKWFVRGEGLVSDNSPVMIFGLGDQSAVSVSVKYLDGNTVAGSFDDGWARFPAR